MKYAAHPQPVKACGVNGRRYGLPIRLNTGVLSCNPTRFDRGKILSPTAEAGPALLPFQMEADK
jgi:ABC-type glycerol-3-phosphate transport system substrate-binding protein